MARRTGRDEHGEMVEEPYEVEPRQVTSERIRARVQYRGWYRSCGRLGHVTILHTTLPLSAVYKYSTI